MNLLLALVITTVPLDTATFAGGCFWSMERAFDQVAGVVSVTVGYTGGTVPRPSYEQVSTGQTGHLESVQVVYDPEKITYERLVDAFWHDIDPTQADGLASRARGTLRETAHHGRRAGDSVLPGGRVSPALLPQESGAVRHVSRRVWPRPAPAGNMGRRSPIDGGTIDHARHKAERRRAAAVADPVTVPGDPARGDGAVVPQRLLGQPPGGYLRGCRLRRAAVQLARQVRVGHRVAKLHQAARGGERAPEVRPVALHDADRGSVRPCRFAPG